MGPDPLLGSDLGNLERELAPAAIDADRIAVRTCVAVSQKSRELARPPVGSVREVHEHAHQVARRGRGI